MREVKKKSVFGTNFEKERWVFLQNRDSNDSKETEMDALIRFWTQKPEYGR